MKKRRLGGAAVALGVVLAVTGLPARASASPTADTRTADTRAALPLGPAGLAETRTTQTLQPGLTLTRIVRGAVDPAHRWTVEATIPGGDTSPDPDAPPTTLKDKASADELAADLRADGFDARAEQVTTPSTTDYAGGTLGWRVRIGSYTSQAAAATERIRIINAGYSGSVTYTGWDGATTDRAPGASTSSPSTPAPSAAPWTPPSAPTSRTARPSAPSPPTPAPSPRSTRASSSWTPAPARPATRRASACTTDAC